MNRLIIGYAYLTIGAGLILAMAVMLRATLIALHIAW